MRKFILLFGLVSILLVSGCINIPGLGQASFLENQLVVQNSDIKMEVRTSSNEIKTGRQLGVQISLFSDKNSLEDISLYAYDQCLFTGDNEYEVESLGPDRVKTLTWRWTAGNTNFETDCNIKFRTSYKSVLTASQDIISMQKAEYYSREEQGTLNEYVPESETSSNPLVVDFSFSEAQPFLEGEEYGMYIDYSYTGEGYIEKLDDVKITVPKFITNVECSGFSYDASSRILTLTRDLDFYNKIGPKTTCKFTPAGTSPIEMEKITLTASYIYKFDNSLLVKVKP